MEKFRLEDQSKLIEIFGDRVNFKLYERRLYSSDIGTMPEVIPLILENMIDSLKVYKF